MPTIESAFRRSDVLDWYEEGRNLVAVTTWGITCCRVRYAEDGEAEGGVTALARFMGGALAPGVRQPPLSPAGWYWQGTVEERGHWTRPAGPFSSPEEAKAAACAAFDLGGWLAEEIPDAAVSAWRTCEVTP